VRTVFFHRESNSFHRTQSTCLVVSTVLWHPVCFYTFDDANDSVFTAWQCLFTLLVNT